MHISRHISQAVAVIGLGVLGAAAPSADALDHPAVVASCGSGVSECARQFEKIVTVYEHNVTTAHINWVTTNVTLPMTTITSTAVTIETKINKTETDALCEKTFIVTLPGTSTVTVHLNATHVNSIIPSTITVTTSTITQYETEVSVCLVQGTQYPFRPRGSAAAEAGASPVPGGEVGASPVPAAQQSARPREASRQEAATNERSEDSFAGDLLEGVMGFIENVMGEDSD
ncbi:hypothetical protein OQA88_2671 [Cercophora sp. LCS_1]